MHFHLTRHDSCTVQSGLWEREDGQRTGTASTDNSEILGKVDGIQYHSRPNPHNACICGQCIRTDTVGTALAVLLVDVGTAWDYTPGGAKRHQTWHSQGSMPDVDPKAGFALTRVPVPIYQRPASSLGNGCTRLRPHSLPVLTGRSPGVVSLSAQG